MTEKSRGDYHTLLIWNSFAHIWFMLCILQLCIYFWQLPHLRSFLLFCIEQPPNVMYIWVSNPDSAINQVIRSIEIKNSSMPRHIVQRF